MKLALSRFPVGNLTKGAESLREKKWQEKPFIAENRPRPIDRTLQKALNLGFMKNYVKVPAFRPLMVFSGTLFGFLVLASSALSYDPSLPYRSRPGFRCLYQNVRGECLNFEFGNSGGSTSSQSSSTSSRSTVTGDDLTLEVESEDGTTLDRGDTVEFTIRLTNDTGRRIRTDVRAFLDTDMTYSSSTNQGRLRVTVDLLLVEELWELVDPPELPNSKFKHSPRTFWYRQRNPGLLLYGSEGSYERAEEAKTRKPNKVPENTIRGRKAGTFT
jgi:hypothetical protein